jgi:hypothetical protein
LLEKLAEKTAVFDGLLRIEAMPIDTVALALRRSTARSVKTANFPTPDGGSLAPYSHALGDRATTRSLLEGMLQTAREGHSGHSRCIALERPDMAADLNGRRIVVPGTRELGQSVRMLEERGAKAIY